jgi:hypothetical protein
MIVIPTSTTEAHYEQVTELDGRAYLLRFDWVQRVERWTLGIYTEGRAPIRTGCMLAANWPIAARVRDARAFPGYLMVISQDGGPPGLTDFAPRGRCFLAYFPAVA